MYSRVIAWASSSGAVGANEVDLGINNVGLEGADLEEGSEDSEEDVNLNFENHISRGVGGGGACLVVATPKSSGKRKEKEHPKLRPGKKRSSGIGAQLLSMQQQFIESMSSRKDSTSANKDLPSCSVIEVMVDFH